MTESIGKEFFKQTRYPPRAPSQETQGLPQPPLELPAEPDQPLIDLPLPADLQIPPINLQQAIEQRRSVRTYSAKPLTLEELSFLLWCTQGVKRVTSRPVTLRTVPSAGSRHAFETYLLVHGVDGLQPGLYRFLAIEHKLALVSPDPLLSSQLTAACLQQRQIKESAVTFIWVAVVERMYWRYGERGYRYLLLDAGHICQNLYLAAEAIQCGVCAIDAFEDEPVNALLGLDGETHMTLYLASLGKKA
jgi:SagB-type dehydrogenase family enzyme